MALEYFFRTYETSRSFSARCNLVSRNLCYFVSARQKKYFQVYFDKFGTGGENPLILPFFLTGKSKVRRRDILISARSFPGLASLMTPNWCFSQGENWGKERVGCLFLEFDPDISSTFFGDAPSERSRNRSLGRAEKKQFVFLGGNWIERKRDLLESFVSFIFGAGGDLVWD